MVTDGMADFTIRNAPSTAANGAIAPETFAVGTLAETASLSDLGIQEGVKQLCLADGCYLVSVGGGTWPEEVSWEFGGTSGGAPVIDTEVCFISSGDMYSEIGTRAIDMYPSMDMYPEA